MSGGGIPNPPGISNSTPHLRIPHHPPPSRPEDKKMLVNLKKQMARTEKVKKMRNRRGGRPVSEPSKQSESTVTAAQDSISMPKEDKKTIKPAEGDARKLINHHTLSPIEKICGAEGEKPEGQEEAHDSPGGRPDDSPGGRLDDSPGGRLEN